MAIKTPKILLDADVVRHFLKGDAVLLLPKIYPGQLVMLDIVKNELCRSTSLRTQVENFVSFTKIEVMSLASHSMAAKEYARLLKRGFGEGESACMAIAYYDKHIIASSNLWDIQKYCSENKIAYVTTMDILVTALEAGIMTEADCDYFIYNVKSKGSKLPCNTIQDYIEKYRNK